MSDSIIKNLLNFILTSNVKLLFIGLTLEDYGIAQKSKKLLWVEKRPPKR